jgi:RNA polymerase sigma-70 factor (ECF subfamily)
MSETDEPEAALCRRAQTGDRLAFAQLVRTHQSAVRKQLRRLTKGDLALAEDLAQESFILAWTHLTEFRVQASLATWLYRIAYNRFLMHVRSHPAALPVYDEQEFAVTGESSGHQAQARAMRLDVAAALARLPEAERVALIHCYYLDLSHEETAQVLSLPLGTVKSQVLRGKVRLRQLLVAWAPEETS